jgi:hypothetical protein
MTFYNESLSLGGKRERVGHLAHEVHSLTLQRHGM